MIDLTEATSQATAFREASKASPVRQIRYELLARAEEFDQAIEDFGEAEGEGRIEMVSSVGRGMRVLHWKHGWVRVIRKLNGGLSLHLDSPDSPQGIYRNFLDETSPVVVRA